MAEQNEDVSLDANVIAEYIMLTGSNESQARYMLALYDGNLNFAVDQHLEGHIPQEVVEEQCSTDQSSALNAVHYLEYCNNDIESAVNMILQSEETNINEQAQRYLTSCSGNVFLAMHNLYEIETGNRMKIDDGKADDRIDVYEAARKYLSCFSGDLQLGINILVELHEQETDTDTTTDTTKEHCRYAEQYLHAVGGDFEKAFNILFEVHQPEQLPKSNEKVFAEEYLAAFNHDSKSAIDALLEGAHQKDHNEVDIQAITHAQTSAKIYVDRFEGNYNQAVQVLIDATDDKQIDVDEKPSPSCVLKSDFQEKYQMQENCPCGNDDPTNLKHYFYEDTGTDEVEFIGIYCKRCNHEYLISDVLNSKHGDNNDDNDDNNFQLVNRNLYRNTKRKVNEAASGSELYTSVDVDDISNLKRGDEFALDRSVYAHHGIVYKVDVESRQFEGIHYKKIYGKTTIIKQTINFDNEVVSKRQYNDFEDNTKLVIARACSCIGDTTYHLFSNNCEHFATFCKTGFSESSQVDVTLEWLKQQLNQILTENNLKTAANVASKFFYLNGKASVLKRTKLVHAGIMVIIEGKTIIVEMSRFTAERRNGDITLIEYVEKSFACIISGLIDVTMRIGVSMAGGNLGACIGRLIAPGSALQNSPAGVFVGSILGGQVGSLQDNTLGNIIGNYLATAIIPRVLRFNDSAVNEVNDLQPGDHIVLNPGPYHPRCHGIVIRHNCVSHMTLLRSTYEKGVVEEEVEFRTPIYRMIYKEGESRDVAETLERGRSKLGTNKYNLLTFNCKHFAQWCKKK